MRECLPPTICHMSGVRCQVSGVRCQVSGIRCQASDFFFFFLLFFLLFFIGQSGEASWWRVCYHRGLPRAAVGHFSNVNFKFFSSYNGDFVAFLMQWEPNGNLIGPVKLKNGDLRLLNCKI